MVACARTALLTGEPAVTAISAAHGNCGEAAVLLRWAVQKGLSVIPRSTDPQRIRANASTVHGGGDSSSQGGGSGGRWLELSADEMAALDRLGQGSDAKRYCWDPSGIR